ncbi:MAG: hypothetical protein AAGA92_00840 [Planctomycetota bacterium]
MPADRFEIEPEQQGTEEKSALSGCLLGCLVVTGLAILFLVAAAWWVSRNWRDLMSDYVSAAVKETLAESGLPEEEQAEVLVQVERLADAFRAGELDGPQLFSIFEELVESPLFSSMLVTAVERGYLDDSGLTDEEKSAGRVTLRRFIRGMVDEEIDEAGFDQVMVHIADKRPDGSWEMRPQATDEQLRELLKTAKQLADEAEVAAEPEEVDPSDELKRIIDAALLGEPAPGAESPADEGGPAIEDDAESADLPPAPVTELMDDRADSADAANVEAASANP